MFLFILTKTDIFANEIKKNNDNKFGGKRKIGLEIQGSTNQGRGKRMDFEIDVKNLDSTTFTDFTKSIFVTF